MARWEIAIVLAALLVLQPGNLAARSLGSEGPVLKCHVEGMNSTPGEAVTFRCVVQPPTALRYCEFRPPSGGSPILLEDGAESTTTVSTTTAMVSTTTATVPTTTSEVSSAEKQDAPLNRTRRSLRGRFYGWSTRLDYVGEGFNVGDCSAAVRKVSLEDAGTWQCVAGIEEQIEELSSKVDLVVHEGSSLPLKAHAEVSNDWSWAHFMCHTTSHKPLRFCRFLRGDGTPLIGVQGGTEIGPGLNMEGGVKYGRYSYSGNGLSAGDCGLSLSSLYENDAGEWLCIVGVSGEEGQQKGVLELKPPPPSLPGGLSLGAILGIGLVSAFILFVIVHEVIERRVSWRDKRAQKKMKQKIAKAGILNPNFNSNGKF